MLVVKDLIELKKEIQKRREVAESLFKSAKVDKSLTKKEIGEKLSNLNGQIYAYDNSLQLIEALLTYNHEEEG